MNLFDYPLAMALLGGILIGVAWGALMLFTGRVMSASGMLGSLLGGAEGVAAPNIAFLGGLVAASLAMPRLGLAQHTVAETSWPLLLIGGLLVGASARLAGTSLGVVATGVARGAPRSLVLLVMIGGGVIIGAVLQGLLGGGAEP